MAEITLKLNDYQAGNLRWLLRLAYEGSDKYNKKVHPSEQVEAKHLFTGDWTGEILWHLEQAMIDGDMEPISNKTDIWPLEGWNNGKKTETETGPEHVCGLMGFGRGREGLNDVCPACEAMHNK